MGILSVNHYHKQRGRLPSGLTLIEVLIALAIAAIALTAVIKAASQNIRGTTYLQNKSIAMWVAQATLAEARLGLIKLPSLSDPVEHSTLMLGQEWYWLAGQEDTPNKRIKKISVKVYAQDTAKINEDETPLVRLESYVYQQE